MTAQGTAIATEGHRFFGMRAPRFEADVDQAIGRAREAGELPLPSFDFGSLAGHAAALEARLNRPFGEEEAI